MNFQNGFAISLCLCLTPVFAQEAELQRQFKEAVRLHAEVWTQASPRTEEFEVGVNQSLVRARCNNYPQPRPCPHG